VHETAPLVVSYRRHGSGGKPILLLAHMDMAAEGARRAPTGCRLRRPELVTNGFAAQRN
jgi:hypothetical protein